MPFGVPAESVPNKRKRAMSSALLTRLPMEKGLAAALKVKVVTNVRLVLATAVRERVDQLALATAETKITDARNARDAAGLVSARRIPAPAARAVLFITWSVLAVGSSRLDARSSQEIPVLVSLCVPRERLESYVQASARKRKKKKTASRSVRGIRLAVIQ